MGSIRDLTTHNVLWGTFRGGGGQIKLQEPPLPHLGHRAGLVECRMLGAATPTVREVVVVRLQNPIHDSTMSWLIMAKPWGCRAAKTSSQASSKNRR